MKRRSAGAALVLSFVMLSLGGACERSSPGPDARGAEQPAATTFTTPASSRRLFVAPTGDDDAAGTEELPWRTLEAALPRLLPGDTLFVRAGTYNERLRQVQITPGRPDARVTVAAYPGERPLIKGLLWLHRPSYWTIRDLSVTWGRGDKDDHMVKLVDGEGWRLEGSELFGARSFAALLVAGTRAGEPADWTVSGNCIHDTRKTNETNQDQLIYVNTGLESGRGVIEGNVLWRAPNGSGVKLGGSAEDEGGAARVAVRNNTIFDVEQGILVAWRSHGNEITSNLIGKIGDRYGAIRGFELNGVGNVARSNAAFDAASFVLNDPGFRGLTVEKDNRFPADPAFDRVDSCDGFRPTANGFDGVGHLGARRSEGS